MIEVNLKLMDALLKPAGYEVITVSLGKENIEIAAKDIIDLILMDISLPDMSGTQAMKKCNFVLLENLLAIPIVLIGDLLYKFGLKHYSIVMLL